MATRGSYVHISMGEFSGDPDNVSFMQFSTKIDGFEQKDSQGFENSYNSYEQYPLEKFFTFTIYQNYTLALRIIQLYFLGENPVRPYIESQHILQDFFPHSFDLSSIF